MRHAIAAMAAATLAPAFACAAAPAAEGRWQGPVQIPGRELRLVVDLNEDAPGRWTGSLIVPGFGVKGAALANVAASDATISFDVAHALGSPTQPPPRFRAELVGTDRMAGEMIQGGHTAPFALARTGPPQVDAPPRSTPVSRPLEGEWNGEFELGGYPRRVTITIANRGDAGATAEFLIVGKQDNRLPVELVVQDGAFLRVESPATQINFEGRLVEAGGELRGTIELGSLELPLSLRRAAAKTS